MSLKQRSIYMHTEATYPTGIIIFSTVSSEMNFFFFMRSFTSDTATSFLTIVKNVINYQVLNPVVFYTLISSVPISQMNVHRMINNVFFSRRNVLNGLSHIFFRSGVF